MEDAVILSLTFGLGIILIALVIFLVARQNKQNASTQREITDADLLRLIDQQPDGLLSPHRLRDLTGLSLAEARGRLNAMSHYGILRRNSNSKGRHFFGLRDSLEEKEALDLSTDPFLTMEDLMLIFRAHDFRVTAQELILATGLPLAVIKREMKYFEKKGIVEKLQRSDSNGVMIRRFFVLQDPYRTDHDLILRESPGLNKEMKEILLNENLIV
jgi:hypothetical protein